ncbi:extracellular solute-binding protein [Microbacterium sp.]|uniref:extracellular solute-binding protein n=1 Tax=Microbacterium sp. TaxID=51671 RepID=UPI0037C7D12B
MVSTARKVLAGLGAVTIAGLLAACAGGTPPAASGSGDDAAPETLTFVGYGGAGQDAMIAAWQDPFTDEHPNITFVNTSPPDLSQVQAQVQAGAIQWDVVAVAAFAAQQNCGTLFEKLDFSDVDETDLVPGAVGECFMTGFYNATPFAYRTDAFPDPATAPKTIADFFDVETYPGQRGVLTNLQNGILEYGLLGDGVSPDSLYPLDVPRSLAKWDTIRDATTFAPNVGALQQAVASNQVDLFLLSDSRLVPTMDEGMDITIVWDETVVTQSAFAVPLGSSHKETAQSFLATLPGPQQVKVITEALGTAPVNLAAPLDLSENAQKLAVFDPSVNTGGTIVQDLDWWATNYNDVQAEVTTWLAG